MNEGMTATATAAAPARSAPVAHLAHSERLWLLEAMARSRVVRRRLAEQRRSARTPALDGATANGWEALEAAACRDLRHGDAVYASAAWPLPLAGPCRVGPAWRLVDVVSAAAGAAMTMAPGSLAITICEAPALRDAVPALETVARRRLPLVILAADRESAGDATMAAEAAEMPFESVRADDAEIVLLATNMACESARASKGPTLIACRGREPDADESGLEFDPIESYARRLSAGGASVAELRAVVRGAKAAP
jgi:hypothetical protein